MCRLNRLGKPTGFRYRWKLFGQIRVQDLCVLAAAFAEGCQDRGGRRIAVEIERPQREAADLACAESDPGGTG